GVCACVCVCRCVCGGTGRRSGVQLIPQDGGSLGPGGHRLSLPQNLSTSPRTPPLSSSTTAGWYTNGLGNNICKEKPFHRFKVIHKSLICTFAVGDPNSTICKTLLLSIFIMASCMYRHVGAGLCLSPSLSREQPPWPTWWECGPWQEELLYLLKLDSPPTSSQLLPSCRWD
ncbi:hypothetical protein GBAR_LOCUS9950, partial [Geodia barretti]